MATREEGGGPASTHRRGPKDAGVSPQAFRVLHNMQHRFGHLKYQNEVFSHKSLQESLPLHGGMPE